MSQRTPLYEQHLARGARMVDFGGWSMPLHYGSQIEEHHAVRRAAGVFDVSHMCILDLAGGRVREFLRHLLANDIAKLKTPGRALYSCMLNEAGGVIDDLIVYFRDDSRFRLVVNAGAADKDRAWIERHAVKFDVSVTPRRDLALLAVQGPNARGIVAGLLPEGLARAEALAPFHAADCGNWFVARTGYTGEDGYEIALPAAEAPALWDALLDTGVMPCGLGARDTLRLEAGMNLYGTDMDERTTPLESGLAWTVAFEPATRAFIGRAALEMACADGVQQTFVGLLLDAPGVLRGHQKVITGAGDGEITSGGFSPTLNRSIALARVPAAARGTCQVEVRGRLLPARIVKPPFVRYGKSSLAEVA